MVLGFFDTGLLFFPFERTVSVPLSLALVKVTAFGEFFFF